MRSGEIVTVGPGGMTGMRSVTGIEATRFPIWMNVQILMPGERTQGHRNMRNETRLVCEAPRDADVRMRVRGVSHGAGRRHHQPFLDLP